MYEKTEEPLNSLIHSVQRRVQNHILGLTLFLVQNVELLRITNMNAR